MPKRLFILLVSLLFVSGSYVVAGNRDTLHTTYVVNSDYVPTHVVTASLGGGMQTLMPKLTDEGRTTLGLKDGLGAGMQLQALYTYYIHKYVGITGGLGFELYSGNMHGAFSDSVYLYDNHPNNQMNYWLYSDYTNFKEREQLYMLTIPVGVTGRINLTDPLQLRGTLGLGMNMIVGSHYRGDGQLTTTAYYPDYNLHFDPDLPAHGFSQYFMGGYQGKIENTFPVSMFIIADIGAHYQFTRRWGIYGGLYFSYTCFNAVRPTVNDAGRRPELVSYDNATKQWTYSGMINSKFVEALHPFAFGVKVGVTITYLSPAKCNCEAW
ncbi:MAG: hypothetical protein IJT12_04050 [Paludibacteraceae bacterium]|nr:hypothetical protein [Paludibacteraceae bacterium]